jgi:curli biogenesis system outer membrane secretion channel CsgG
MRNKNMKKSRIPGIVALLITVNLIISCFSSGEPGDDSYDYYDISEAVNDLALQLQNSYKNTHEIMEISEMKKKRLAILDCVDAEGIKTPLGKQISGTLQSEIFNPGLFSLLERERIENMLDEYTFSNSGMVEEVSASELGKLLGAEIVVVISYTSEVDSFWEETRYKISARIVNLETGEILGIGRVAFIVPDYY